MSVAVSDRMGRVAPSATNTLMGLAMELKAAGRDIISLAAGEPDFDTPAHVRRAASDAIDAGHTKYTAIDGIAPLKQAIISKFARDNSLAYTPEQILVSVGAKHTLFNACMALLSPGDEAIVPTPCWVSYPDMVRLADGTPITVETGIDTDFKMTPAQLEAAISDRTRVLFLNSPSNPTGTSYTKGELQALGAVLSKHPQIIVLADDIYEHIHWADEAFCSLVTACPDLYEQVLTVNGVSKCYAMTGWRIGYAGGPAHVIKAMKTIQSQVTSNPCSISQYAATAALMGDQQCVAEMTAQYRERSDYVVAALNEVDGFECRSGEGAFYAFPRVTGALGRKGLDTDNELVELLIKEADVVTVPGSAFAAPGYIRLSFACSMQELEEALGRIQRVLG